MAAAAKAGVVSWGGKVDPGVVAGDVLQNEQSGSATRKACMSSLQASRSSRRGHPQAAL